MFTRYKSGVHEALDNNPKTARWQWLHNDSNRCRTPFYGEMLNRLRRRLFKLLKSEFSKPCATLINNFPECRKGFWKCSHRTTLLNVSTIRQAASKAVSSIRI